MKLYTYEESGNSYKVRLLLALMGQEIEQIEVDLMTDEQHGDHPTHAENVTRVAADAGWVFPVGGRSLDDQRRV